MSASWHITKSGEPGRCKAEAGRCPLGGEHFDNPEAAREAYESDMKEMQFAQTSAETAADEYERSNFFRDGNEGNYTLIDVQTGTVFSTNAVVMEAPDDDDFYESPTDFTDDAQYRAVPLVNARSLDSYRAPVIVELDTDLVVGVDAENIYAVDHSKNIIEFDEILDSSSAAEECAHSQGFRLWA